MNWGDYIKPIKESGIVDGGLGSIILELFEVAGCEVTPSQESAKKWVEGSRKCKSVTYFPRHRVKNEEVFRFFRNRPDNKLQALQKVYRTNLNPDSPIDVETDNMDVFCWSLVNQFLDLLNFQRIDIPNPKGANTEFQQAKGQNGDISKEKGAVSAQPHDAQPLAGTESHPEQIANASAPESLPSTNSASASGTDNTDSADSHIPQDSPTSCGQSTEQQIEKQTTPEQPASEADPSEPPQNGSAYDSYMKRRLKEILPHKDKCCFYCEYWVGDIDEEFVVTQGSCRRIYGETRASTSPACKSYKMNPILKSRRRFLFLPTDHLE